jgi:hypothetical protein
VCFGVLFFVFFCLAFTELSESLFSGLSTLVTHVVISKCSAESSRVVDFIPVLYTPVDWNLLDSQFLLLKFEGPLDAALLVRSGFNSLVSYCSAALDHYCSLLGFQAGR